MLIKQDLPFTIYVICGWGTHFMTHVVVSPHLYCMFVTLLAKWRTIQVF